jgi:hypothetical protein
MTDPIARTTRLICVRMAREATKPRIGTAGYRGPGISKAGS